MNVKIRKKVGIIVASTIILIAGLFVLRSYYGEKLGIFADQLTDEKIIYSKSVADGDFDADSITGLTKSGDVLQVNNTATQICGNSPASVDTSGLSQTKEFAVKLDPTPAVAPYTVKDFMNSYSVGALPGTPGGGNFKLLPADDSSLHPSGFSIIRGNGWLRVELSENRPEGTPTSYERNVISGTITFPTGVKVNQDSIRFDVSGDGLEEQGNGTHDITSGDDEVLVSQENQNTVEFYLSTTTRKDSFYINYCFLPVIDIEGTVSGQVDLGAIKPISSLKTEVLNFIPQKDDVFISAQISKDGQNWIKGQEINARLYNFQGSAPRDSYCFRYIKYNIRIVSDIRNYDKLGFSGLIFNGGDVCGTEQAFLPSDVSDKGAACSNGVDDDGDGKIDFDPSGQTDPGCSSKMDDSETDARVICRNGSNENIQLKINISQHKDAFGNDLGKKTYVGAEEQPVENNRAIELVSDGASVKDKGFKENVQGLSLYRGENYFFIYNQTVGLDREAIEGAITLTGAKITKVVDFHFDDPTDGIVEFNVPDKDEYSFTPGESTGTFTTTVQNGKDGVFVYYDYVTKIGGGCQCQDTKDNDSDKYIDYPQDFGCNSAGDNDELQTTAQIVRYPSCKNEIDDDGDGNVDYPDDPGCESVLDDAETDPVKVCRAGDATSMTATFKNYSAEYTSGTTSIENRIVAGDKSIYSPGEKIKLVENGGAIVDPGIADPNTGSAYVKRGPGYLYVWFKRENTTTGALRSTGDIVFEGTKITKIIEGSIRLASSAPFGIGGEFENSPTDPTASDSTNPDEFTISSDKSTVSFTSFAGTDSLYIYYDYVDTLAGGCGCQDGIDNDSDGLVDFPNDKGCASADDNDEKDTITSLISQPTRILPALIVSGTGFLILIIIILAISGITIYITVKKDKDKVDN